MGGPSINRHPRYGQVYLKAGCTDRRSVLLPARFSSNVIRIVIESDALGMQYSVLRVRQAHNLPAYCIYPNIQKTTLLMYVRTPCVATAHQYVYKNV